METYRITEGVSVYYLTFSIVEWLPVFVQGDACEIVTNSLRFCHEAKGLRVNAYVIMPTHMHCMLFDHEHDERRLEKTITAFRKFTGRQLAEFAAKADRVDRGRQFWQQSRHPEAITSAQFWQQKCDYIHDNPCRKGLVRYPDD